MALTWCQSSFWRDLSSSYNLGSTCTGSEGGLPCIAVPFYILGQVSMAQGIVRFKDVRHLPPETGPLGVFLLASVCRHSRTVAWELLSCHQTQHDAAMAAGAAWQLGTATKRETEAQKAQSTLVNIKLTQYFAHQTLLTQKKHLLSCFCSHGRTWTLHHILTSIIQGGNCLGIQAGCLVAESNAGDSHCRCAFARLFEAPYHLVPDAVPRQSR